MSYKDLTLDLEGYKVYTEKIIPLIEAKYDEIYELCEKGNKLLY